MLVYRVKMNAQHAIMCTTNILWLSSRGIPGEGKLIGIEQARYIAPGIEIKERTIVDEKDDVAFGAGQNKEGSMEENWEAFHV